MRQVEFRRQRKSPHAAGSRWLHSGPQSPPKPPFPQTPAGRTETATSNTSQPSQPSLHCIVSGR